MFERSFELFGVGVLARHGRWAGNGEPISSLICNMVSMGRGGGFEIQNFRTQGEASIQKGNKRW